jgi:hypothetical protein
MARDFHILHQVPRMNLNAAGNGFSNDWEVTYQVDDGPARGTVATVTVPQADHNPTYMDRAIREQIANLHGIASLGSSD